ncbi:hypothetical protein ABIC30_005985 [Methylobacterium sp. 1030]
MKRKIRQVVIAADFVTEHRVLLDTEVQSRKITIHGERIIPSIYVLCPGRRAPRPALRLVKGGR